MGEMADLDRDRWFEDDEDVRLTMCAFCKRGPFEWMKADGKWRLYTITGKVHKCKAWQYRRTLPQQEEGK